MRCMKKTKTKQKGMNEKKIGTDIDIIREVVKIFNRFL